MGLEATLRSFFSRWYRDHGRDFPWRARSTSPFGMLIVEMLLRQTRAEMVAAVWPSFITQYPSPGACASAGEHELYELLAPLGLGRQRVEAVRAASAALVNQHGGRVPRSVDKLVALPHVGLYAAHAVACFAYGRRVPVVDVNVIRVLSRLTGENFGRDNRRAPRAWELAWRILPGRGVKEHNYGMLDFSAQICLPRNPAIERCPLAPHCTFSQEAR